MASSFERAFTQAYQADVARRRDEEARIEQRAWQARQNALEGVRDEARQIRIAKALQDVRMEGEERAKESALTEKRLGWASQYADVKGLDLDQPEAGIEKQIADIKDTQAFNKRAALAAHPQIEEGETQFEMMPGGKEYIIPPPIKPVTPSQWAALKVSEDIMERQRKASDVEAAANLAMAGDEARSLKAAQKRMDTLTKPEYNVVVERLNTATSTAPATQSKIINDFFLEKEIKRVASEKDREHDRDRMQSIRSSYNSLMGTKKTAEELFSLSPKEVLEFTQRNQEITEQSGDPSDPFRTRRSTFWMPRGEVKPLGGSKSSGTVPGLRLGDPFSPASGVRVRKVLEEQPTD